MTLALGALLSTAALADGSTIWSGNYNCAAEGRTLQVEVRELDGAVAFMRVTFPTGSFLEGVPTRHYDASTGNSTLSVGVQAIRFSSSGEPTMLAGGSANVCSKR